MKVNWFFFKPIVLNNSQNNTVRSWRLWGLSKKFICYLIRKASPYFKNNVWSSYHKTMSSVTLLSVWSPSWTFKIWGGFVLPVTAAKYSIKVVLPHPIGPSNKTGLWNATAIARFWRFVQADSTKTKWLVVFSC